MEKIIKNNGREESGDGKNIADPVGGEDINRIVERFSPRGFNNILISGEADPAPFGLSFYQTYWVVKLLEQYNKYYNTNVPIEVYRLPFLKDADFSKRLVWLSTSASYVHPSPRNPLGKYKVFETPYELIGVSVCYKNYDYQYDKIENDASNFGQIYYSLARDRSFARAFYFGTAAHEVTHFLQCNDPHHIYIDEEEMEKIKILLERLSTLYLSSLDSTTADASSSVKIKKMEFDILLWEFDSINDTVVATTRDPEDFKMEKDAHARGNVARVLAMLGAPYEILLKIPSMEPTQLIELLKETADALSKIQETRPQQPRDPSKLKNEIRDAFSKIIRD